VKNCTCRTIQKRGENQRNDDEVLPEFENLKTKYTVTQLWSQFGFSFK
jgi:hypothetical protein